MKLVITFLCHQHIVNIGGIVVPVLSLPTCDLIERPAFQIIIQVLFQSHQRLIMHNYVLCALRGRAEEARFAQSTL